MPANMMSAPVGSSLTVSGSSIATVSAGPTPGSTPTNVPSVTPINPHIRFIGCRATPKPAIRAWNASTSDSRAAEQRRKPARRQIHVEQLDEEQVDREGKHQADGDISRPPGTVESPGHARKEHGAGDDESGPADQHHVRKEPSAHPHERAGLKDFVLLGALAPAAAESLEGEPQPEQDDPGRHHRRDEVRADAGVAALRGQGRGHRGDTHAERDHARRERDLRPGTDHYFLLLEAERIHDAGDALL